MINQKLFAHTQNTCRVATLLTLASLPPLAAQNQDTKPQPRIDASTIVAVQAALENLESMKDKKQIREDRIKELKDRAKLVGVDQAIETLTVALKKLERNAVATADDRSASLAFGPLIHKVEDEFALVSNPAVLRSRTLSNLRTMLGRDPTAEECEEYRAFLQRAKENFARELTSEEAGKVGSIAITLGEGGVRFQERSKDSLAAGIQALRDEEEAVRSLAVRIIAADPRANDIKWLHDRLIRLKKISIFSPSLGWPYWHSGLLTDEDKKKSPQELFLKRIAEHVQHPSTDVSILEHFEILQEMVPTTAKRRVQREQKAVRDYIQKIKDGLPEYTPSLRGDPQEYLWLSGKAENKIVGPFRTDPNFPADIECIARCRCYVRERFTKFFSEVLAVTLN